MMKKSFLCTLLSAIPLLLAAGFEVKDDTLIVTTPAMTVKMDLNFGMITSIATRSGDSFCGQNVPLADLPFRKSMVPFPTSNTN